MAASPRHEELDGRGTSIWNLSTRLKREGGNAHGRKLTCLLRAFAFLLLDSAYQPSGSTIENAVRLQKVALKAAKYCLEERQIELCQTILGRAAVYNDAFSSTASNAKPEGVELLDRLKAEYFILRAALAWKQERLDVAEHMYSKSSIAPDGLGPAMAETLADLLYEMGKEMLEKKQYELAVRWLERAYDTVAEQDLERMSADAGELRLCIMSSLVRALLSPRGSGGHEDIGNNARAWHLLQLMENEFPEKLVVSLLTLDLLLAEAEMQADRYRAVLNKMIRTVTLTASNVKTVMHYIHKIRERQPNIACGLLDTLITIRLFDASTSMQEWLDKAIVTRVWISTDMTGDEVIKGTQRLFDETLANIGKPLEPTVTHAAQALIWKRIESEYATKRYETALQWCHLASHGLFERAGELNIAKLQRKTISCALGMLDLVSARETFYRMSETARAAPITSYLMYKVALQSGDAEFGQSSEAVILCNRVDPR